MDRDTTSGALTWAQVIKKSGSTNGGLDGARAVAISPDGKHVYVAGNGDDAIVRLDRDTTSGALTWAQVIKDHSMTDGLDGAYSVTVSPDSKSVYVVSTTDNAIVRLEQLCK